MCVCVLGVGGGGGPDLIQVITLSLSPVVQAMCPAHRPIPSVHSMNRALLFQYADKSDFIETFNSNPRFIGY